MLRISIDEYQSSNAFLETLKNDEDSRMIICTRSDVVKRRIKRIFPRYSERIAYFGEEEFIRDLEARLQNQNEGVEIEEN
jgi:hypothetical protein